MVSPFFYLKNDDHFLLIVFKSDDIFNYKYRRPSPPPCPTLSRFPCDRLSTVLLSIQPQKIFTLSLRCHPLDGVTRGGLPPHPP